MSNDLTVVIVSYNSADVIIRCMNGFLLDSPYRILIIDNASTDDSANKLKQQYPNLEVIQCDQNLGYGRAANRAFKKVNTPFAFLINPDLLITVASVEKLLDRMIKQSEISLLAPAVDKESYTRQGVVLRQWIIGAAMMFRLESFRAIGQFDENIFLFSEETDICYRLIKSGRSIGLDSDVYVEHLYRQSSGSSNKVEYLKNWHMGWSRLYYYKKHGMAIGKHNPYRLLLLYCLKSIVAVDKTKRLMYRAKRDGTYASIRGRPAFKPNGDPQGI